MDVLNKTLFAFAAYNAGPARVQRLRREAGERGPNPNIWFNNVEVVAAERIGAETVTYVANIFKYYVAYTLVTQNDEAHLKARQSVGRYGPSTVLRIPARGGEIGRQFAAACCRP